MNVGFNVMKSRVWPVFRRYAAKPGHVVQTVRRYPEYIKKKQIDHRTIKVARDIFAGVKDIALPSIYYFLEACFELYDAVTLQRSLEARPEHSGFKTRRNTLSTFDQRFMGLNYTFRDKYAFTEI